MAFILASHASSSLVVKMILAFGYAPIRSEAKVMEGQSVVACLSSTSLSHSISFLVGRGEEVGSITA